MSKNSRKLSIGVALAGVLLILSVFLRQFGLFSTLNQSLTHWLYTDASEHSKQIVIVAIDDRTLADAKSGGLGSLGSWSWVNYGEVIDQIEAGQPKSIFVDLFFSQPSTVIRKNSLITLLNENNNLSDFGKAVIDYLKEDSPDDLSFSQTLSKYQNIFGYKKTAGTYTLEANQFHYDTEIKPYDLIGDQMKLGFYNLNLNPDSSNTSIIYGLPLTETVGGNVGEHVDLMLAKDYLNQDDLEKNVPVENGQMLIRYQQKPYDWEMVSFLDVYEGHVDPEFFKDKIVLLGVESLSLHDFYYTPLDPTTPMNGIEIHANAIQTLLDGNFLSYQSTGAFVLLLGALLLLGLFSFLYLPVLWSSFVFVLELATYLLLARWSFAAGVVLDFVWPFVALTVAYFAALAYRNFTEFAEKRKLKEAFSHYVAPEVVSTLSEHPEQLALGGERRSITAFFLDIENFTHLSEGLSPQDVVKLINTYFDALSKVIMAEGGSVDKFEGDAIMALFGAPVPCTDHAERACRAALKIREKMGELNAATGQTLNVRIGLATGDAIVGNMGSEERFDYTAMGDTVNTASRLEGANKFYKTRILVTEATAKAAQSGIFFRLVDTVCLKGKDQALKIYEVMGSQEGASQDGKALVSDWEKALESYKAGHFEEAEKGIRAVLSALPHDGPAETLLARIAILKMNTPPDWDGVWSFEEK